MSDRYYYSVDEQGSTSFITDSAGNVKNEYWYDAFGNVLDSKQEVHNRITYTGQQFDGISQQYYLRARFYNPIIGRFTQEDVYRGDGLNLYAYCGNNPTIYVDPSGYSSCDSKTQPTNSYNNRYVTDKYGNFVKGKDGNKQLRPNIEYIDPNNGYKYKTDKHGRIISAEGNLVHQKGTRNSTAQRTVGENEGRVKGNSVNYQNDDGGHLFATQFYGSGDIDNMVAMNRQVNRSGGSWYAMEQEWANALDGTGNYSGNQSSVSVKIKVKYDDSNGVSKRPTTFKGFYIINGRKTQFVIKNSYGG